jgi:hypothetical protein
MAVNATDFAKVVVQREWHKVQQKLRCSEH